MLKRVLFLNKYRHIILLTDSLNNLSGSSKDNLIKGGFIMKLIVKTLMVTFLLSSVGIVYAQGPVDKTKDEIVKEKSSDTKSTKGASAGRLGGDTAAPTKDTGSTDAVKDKKSLIGNLGGKSSPEGHSSKSAAPSSRGGSSKKGAQTKEKGASAAPSAGSGEKDLDKGKKDKQDDDG